MKDYICLGIAGNFANHLKQAGEASGFENIDDEEDGAPKGLFPFYVPNESCFLGRYCMDCDKLIIPANFNVQAEPEIAIDFEVIYEDSTKLVKNIIPKNFMAFNDVSVRNDKKAKKLSEKKNFSTASKGFGDKIKIDHFSKGGICDSYSLTSFLITSGDAYQYGDNTKLTNYSYFYQKLIDWIIKKINTQQNHSILENISEIFRKNSYPKNMLISIGATSYTPLAEDRWLEENDEICVVAYNHNIYTNEQIRQKLLEGARSLENASIARQKVVILR